MDRRDFLKFLGMNAAMTTLVACSRRPVEKIIPYLVKPEEITIGIANFYASTCGECPAACGTLVKTREGRPIKMEGNPHHVMSKGGLCARGQASLINLYDPDRLRGPRAMKRTAGKGEAIPWGNVDTRVSTALNKIHAGRGAVRILMGTTTSPATKAAVADFVGSFRNGKIVWFDPVSYENVVKAQELSYGTAVMPRYRFDKADYVLSFGADFLGTHVSPVEFTKGFAAKRALLGKTPEMSRFTAFESFPNTTSGNADRCIPIRPGDELAVAVAIARAMGIAPDTLKEYKTDVDPKIIETIAHELRAHRGKAIVIGGTASPGNPQALALELVVNLLNSTLGNEGETIDGTARPSNQALGTYVAMLELIDEMKAGSVDMLLIQGVNPVYQLPVRLEFAEASTKVPLVISFNDRIDETAALCDYVCPTPHALESWGDAEPQKSIHSLQQPAISPLFDTRAFQDSLMVWAKADTTWYDYLRGYWQKKIFAVSGVTTSFDAFWESVLREGVFVENRNDTSSARALKTGVFASAPHPHLPPPKGDGVFRLALYATVAQHDGRHANNAWLQELPDPITKITWDNYINIAPATANRLDLMEGNTVVLSSDTSTIEAPIHIQPGMHPQALAIAVGYGRSMSGVVGNGVGVNAYSLTSGDLASHVGWSGQVVTLQKTGRTTTLACTQGHQTMEGRPIIKETTLDAFLKNPRAGNEEEGHLISMWDPHKYPGHKWGMAINLNSCTGCSACVVACQSENNIPTVGKEQVTRNRIMHWLRIDRYYSGDEANPQVSNQPMLCQHCDNAPCETVCPVVATTHSDEGLNQQIYNRCVGTRYCLNNCPYKARRFNFLTYSSTANPEPPLHLLLNPDVTVRTRGVMEKCTFCVQRIEEKKSWAKDRGLEKIPDGELKTACQQSCPADAIVFGDANDPHSKLAKLMQHPRGYNVLAELNTRPAITYLTKVRNG